MIILTLKEQLFEAEEKLRALQEELAQTNRGLVALTMELEDRVEIRTQQLTAAQAELSRSNSELLQMTLELEDRVASRMAELKLANESLRTSRIAAMNLMEDAVEARKIANDANRKLHEEILERKRAEEDILRQLKELQRWQEVTLGREDRIRELKREVNELLLRLNETIRYPSQESNAS
jgi:hypothetical protein